jgi:uncharacterized protein YbjT (DUF2867 family)
MILVTTAGKVNSEAARLLARRGERVRLVVRDPGAATALVHAGIDRVERDLKNPKTIDAAMQGSQPWCSSVQRYPPRS